MEKHKLSEINAEARTGVCSVCGPVKLKKRDKTRFRCSNKHRETQRPIDWKRNAERSGSLADEYVPGEKERRLGEQHNLCALCDKSITLITGRLDHDHSTGKTRGVLCNGCNVGLGLFGDNIQTLQRAVRYLEHAGVV